MTVPDFSTDSAIIMRAKLKRLPDNLGLNDIALLLFYHRLEAATNDVLRFEENMAAINFMIWINNQVKVGQIPIEERNNIKLGAFFGDVLEPILNKNEIRTCLEMLELFPLEEGCLLANWWADEQPQAEALGYSASFQVPDEISINVTSTLTQPKIRRPQQRLNKILELISQAEKPLDHSKKIDHLCIPEGVRGIVKTKCLEDKELFPGEWAFEAAWTFGNKSGQIRIKDKEKYL